MILVVITSYEMFKHMVSIIHKFLMLLPSRQILVPRTIRGRPVSTCSGRPLKILFDHPGDFSNLRPDLTFWGRLEMTSRGRLNLTSNGRPWKGEFGRPQDFLRTSRRRPGKHVLGAMWGHLLDAPKFLLIFFSELIRLTRSI